MNQEFERLFGYTQQEITDRLEAEGPHSLWTLLMPEDWVGLQKDSWEAVLGMRSHVTHTAKVKSRQGLHVKCCVTLRHNIDAKGLERTITCFTRLSS